jgi:hypothetical protein
MSFDMLEQERGARAVGLMQQFTHLVPQADFVADVAISPCLFDT